MCNPFGEVWGGLGKAFAYHLGALSHIWNQTLFAEDHSLLQLGHGIVLGHCGHFESHYTYQWRCKGCGEAPLAYWALLLAFRAILLIRKGMKLCWP